MPHADTTVLDAFAARLVSMTQVADANVYTEHIWDFTTAVLPAVDINVPESQIDEDEEGTLGGMLLRRLTITVDIYAKLSSGLGDKLREIAAEVITKIVANATDTDLGGVVSELDLIGEVLVLSDEEEKPIGRLTQTWEAVYRVLVNDPSTIQS